MAMFSDAVINLFFNADNANKGIEKFKEKTKSTFSSVAGGVIKGGAALSAAYFGVKALKDVYNGMLNVVNVSDKWGRSSEDVSRMVNILSLFGGGADEAILAIDKVEDAIASLKTGGGGALKDLSGKIAINIEKQNGAFKTSFEVIEELRKQLSGLSQAGKIKAVQELGLDSPAMLRMLTATNAEYAEMKKSAKSFGVINADNARQIKAIDKTIATMTNLFQSLFGEVFGAMSPVLDDMLPTIKSVGQAVASIIRFLTPGLRLIAKIATITLKSIADILDALFNLDFSKMLSSIASFFVNFGEVIMESIVSGASSAFKHLGRFGRFIGRQLGIVDNDDTDKLKTNLTPEILNREIYASHAPASQNSSMRLDGMQSTQTTNANRTLQIGNITVNATDAGDFGQKLVNTLNNQTASSLTY